MAAVVVDDAGEPVAGARVTCYNEDMTISATATTAANGEVRLNVPLEKGKKGFVTVFGSSIVPIIDQPVSF